jgi:hypothetical protein
VCVVGKNYRLQDIQLRKSVRSFRAASLPLPAVVERRLRGELLSILLSVSSRWKLGAGDQQSGEYRARTGDLLVANQALSQLS